MILYPFLILLWRYLRMSNYFSMKSLIDAGTSNMTVIRNNVKNDDDVDTISMPSWFKFNNKSYSNCYVSGNSWLGFASQSNEAIRINRRDAASWYVWQESGVVCLEEFVKIRWRGYSYYNTTSESALLEYDVIFLDFKSLSNSLMRSTRLHS